MIVPNWIDTAKVYDIPRSENKIIKKYNLDKDKFYVCYSGNIGHSQNLELLVDVAKSIEKYNDIEFVVIGEGAAKAELASLIDKEKLKNIYLLPFQPYEEIAHVFSLGDIGLIISKPGIGGSSVPSKTWSIMAAHRPVLASFDQKGQLKDVLNDSKCGILVQAGNSEKLVEAILELYKNASLKDTLATNGYRFVTETAQKDKCVKEYVLVIT